MLERGDFRRARGLGPRVARARRAIESFIQRGAAYVGVSWGKDSVVVAHLARSVSPAVPLCWVTLPGADNPDCEAVRDEYLSRWPQPYHEVAAPPPRVEGGWLVTGARRAGYTRAHALLGRRRILGIRADESKMRTLSAAVHGEATADVCRPILRWSAADVYAYLAHHDLPVHPAYAMSMGGTLDRDWLRVASIGGRRGAEHGRGWRREWERAYYGDVLGSLGSRDIL